MAKHIFWLIIIWSVICASGLAIYLFQVFKPIMPGTSVDSFDIGSAIGFWILVWALPVGLLAYIGRRKRNP